MIDICAVCQQTCEYIDCPTGGWWSHLTHPADRHDADVWGYTTWPTTTAVRVIDDLDALSNTPPPETWQERIVAITDCLMPLADALDGIGELASGGVVAQ